MIDRWRLDHNHPTEHIALVLLTYPQILYHSE